MLLAWERAGAYLIHHVPQFFFNLLFCSLEALPEVVADAAALEEGAQRGFRPPYRNDPVNILRRAAQEGGLEHALGHPRCLLVGFNVQEGEVDISLGVRAEPWR